MVALGPASVWGWGPPNSTVSVVVGTDAPVTAVANTDEQWRVSLAPHAASASATTLTATSAGVTISVTDILFGDVWLCSGQVWHHPSPLVSPHSFHVLVHFVQRACKDLHACLSMR
jgi:hypothetical protein